MRQLNILLDSMIVGDGSVFKKERYNNIYNKTYIDKGVSYCTYSKKLMNDVSEIVLKCCKTPIIYNIKPDGYVIRITKKRKTPIIRKKMLEKCFQEIDYDGKVYCVEVPNHIIYVKRRGKPVWCGNSYRKAMEMYNGKYSSRFKRIADTLETILKPEGKVISFGYHSTFMGKKRGYELSKLCVFAHGGAQHCTIGIVEEKNERYR